MLQFKKLSQVIKELLSTMNQVKKNYDCFVHLGKFPNIIDFLASLSLAFVALNKPSNSKYCHNCVTNIQFYIEERKGYVLEEM